MNIGKLQVSLIVVYMPHGGYSDQSVQCMYDEMSKQIDEARSKKRCPIIGGDWNAEVQSDCEE
eukprot:11349718-Karenia_brevis.AAC.1